MKKIYSILAAALLAAPSFAQVVLVSPNDGKEYGDGSTMTIVPEVVTEEYDWQGEHFVETTVTFHAPELKNKGSKQVEVYAEYDIVAMPHGSFQDCIGGNCKTRPTVGHYKSEVAVIEAKSTATTLMEWNCGNGFNEDFTPKFDEGTCSIKLDLYVDGSKQSSYTINYVYDKKQAGVASVAAGSQQQTVVRDLQGRVAGKGAKGLLVKGGKVVLCR